MENPENYPLLSEYKMIDNSCLLIECPFIPIQDDTVRLYYKPITTGKKHGFDFVAVDPASIGMNGDYWDLSRVTVRVVYKGIAMFDGINHLYMGSNDTDNFGYLYYHDLDASIEIFQALNGLVEQYCARVA